VTSTQSTFAGGSTAHACMAAAHSGSLSKDVMGVHIWADTITTNTH
jgi:hypothetical protein